MKTIKFKNSKHFIILALLLLGFVPGYTQNDEILPSRTPYPIIFVHGLVGNNGAWYKDGVDNDIIEKLKATGLTFGGNLKVNLNTTRKINQYESIKELDVKVIQDLDFQSGDFYTINFDVHSTLNDNVGNRNLSFVDEFVLPLKSDNTFKVTYPENFKIGDIIRIDYEFMEVKDIVFDQLHVERGIWGTNILFSNSSLINIKKIYNLSTEGNQSSVVKQGYGLKLAIKKIILVWRKLFWLVTQWGELLLENL